jgi:hypothetical protein
MGGAEDRPDPDVVARGGALTEHGTPDSRPGARRPDRDRRRPGEWGAGPALPFGFWVAGGSFDHMR